MLNSLWIPFVGKPGKAKDNWPFADIYIRLIAMGIDFSILYFLFNHFFHLISLEIYKSVDLVKLAAVRSANILESAGMIWQSHLPLLWLMNAGIQIVILGVVLVGTQFLWGSTPGKKLTGLKIVKAQTLEPPEKWRYVLRYLAYLPSGASIVGILILSFNPKRRALHDYIAGTAVIHARPKGWEWEQVKRGFHWLRAKLRRKD